jgi:hypothetical protein
MEVAPFFPSADFAPFLPSSVATFACDNLLYVGGSHRLAKAPFRFYRLLLQPSVQIEPMWWKRFTLL